jgi:hypothetical protein
MTPTVWVSVKAPSIFRVSNQSAVSMIPAVLGFQPKRRLHAAYDLDFQPKRDFHAVYFSGFNQSAISMLSMA